MVLGLMKSPSVTNDWTDATAPPKAIEVGRMMATGPRFWSRKWVGSGMIKLDCKVSPFKDSGSILPWAALNVEKVTVELFTGSTSVKGVELPALSCQVWKCMVALGPMLSRILKTSRLVTRCAGAG